MFTYDENHRVMLLWFIRSGRSARLSVRGSPEQTTHSDPDGYSTGCGSSVRIPSGDWLSASIVPRDS